MSLACGVLGRYLGFLRITPSLPLACGPEHFSFSTGVTLNTASKAKSKPSLANKAKARTSAKAKVAKPVKKVLVVPEKKKRAPSAYNLFVREAGKVKDIPSTDRMKHISGQFRQLKPAEKEKYEIEAAAGRQKFLEEKKAKAGPQRPLSAYNLFIRDKMPDRPKDQRVQEYMGFLSGEFKTYPKADLEKYESLAKKDRERYQKEVASLPEKPKERSLSAYNFYVRDLMPHRNKDEPVKVSMAKLGEEWKIISTQRKQKYLDLAAIAKTEFLATHPKEEFKVFSARTLAWKSLNEQKQKEYENMAAAEKAKAEAKKSSKVHGKKV